MELIAPIKDQFVLHIDLHETTDSDESEFARRWPRVTASRSSRA